ncbi:hypothetical protein D9M71_244220 [compost metagenome]
MLSQLFDLLPGSGCRFFGYRYDLIAEAGELFTGFFEHESELLGSTDSALLYASDSVVLIRPEPYVQRAGNHTDSRADHSSTKASRHIGEVVTDTLDVE